MGTDTGARRGRGPDLPTADRGTGEVPVVFVHGVLDRGRSFADVSELLEATCRMRWYDRRGYGGAADASAMPVGVPAHVDDLIAVVDGWRCGAPVVLAAHSFGGVIALGAAARAPELVRAVVCYESVLPWAPGWDDATMSGVIGADDPIAAGLGLMVGDRLTGLAPDRADRLRGLAAAFITEERSVRVGDPPFDVGDIRAPVVYGRSDFDRIAAIPAFLRTRVGTLDEVVVDGADHAIHRSNPAAYAELVQRAISLS